MAKCLRDRPTLVSLQSGFAENFPLFAHNDPCTSRPKNRLSPRENSLPPGGVAKRLDFKTEKYPVNHSIKIPYSIIPSYRKVNKGRRFWRKNSLKSSDLPQNGVDCEPGAGVTPKFSWAKTSAQASGTERNHVHSSFRSQSAGHDRCLCSYPGKFLFKSLPG